jgi:hypothetical protein
MRARTSARDSIPAEKKSLAPGPGMSRRTSRIIIVLAAIAFAAALCYLPSFTSSSVDEARSSSPDDAAVDVEAPASSAQQAVPVPANRTADVADGFQGEVHPALHGETRLAVTARWTRPGRGRDKLDARVIDNLEELLPEQMYAVFRDAKPAQQTHVYTQREFSAFMPDKIESAGQLWAMNLDKVAGVLKQFHPNVSMHPRAKGRRAGPDGAFGVLRAVSTGYLDIAFRLHAEFNLTPKEYQHHALPITMWCTPANFTGQMLVNRKAGTVDYFHLDLPRDKTLNMHFTVFADFLKGEQHDIVRVEHMELTGGDSTVVNGVRWDQFMELAQANAKLAHEFYKFNDIAWVPTEKALSVARESKKPILAMVMWGSLDDQSC